MNFLDLFALKLREKRIQQKITQRGLAEKLNMCTRTIIEIENCKSNPKFETVALISKESCKQKSIAEMKKVPQNLHS